MINPSTADAEEDDATIRKLIGFAKRNGWGHIIVVNLFGYRATDVNELNTTTDNLSGEGNSTYIHKAMLFADDIVFAWGSSNKVKGRAKRMFDDAVDYCVRMAAILDKKPICLGTTKSGDPRHPLMLAYATELEEWTQ